MFNLLSIFYTYVGEGEKMHATTGAQCVARPKRVESAELPQAEMERARGRRKGSAREIFAVCITSYGSDDCWCVGD
jgi:hypothetical protein